jgi:hypothetical protein
MQLPSPGSVGRALTRLAPSGNIEVDGSIYPARSDGDEIAEGSEVVVTGFDPQAWSWFRWEDRTLLLVQKYQLRQIGDALRKDEQAVWGIFRSPERAGSILAAVLAQAVFVTVWFGCRGCVMDRENEKLKNDEYQLRQIKDALRKGAQEQEKRDMKDLERMKRDMEDLERGR